MGMQEDIEEIELTELWDRLIKDKQLKYQGNHSKRDGSKGRVYAHFKNYWSARDNKWIQQVHFRYGTVWYRFDLVGKVPQDAIVEAQEVAPSEKAESTPVNPQETSRLMQ